MVDHVLAVVIGAFRQYVAYVAGLHRVVAVLVHEAVRLLEVTLVVARAGRGLMMHNQPDALAVRVLVEGGDVEVRIWGEEVEDVVLVAVGPVFPAYVPAFHEDGVESVLGGEVYVFAYVLVVGGVPSVRLGGGVVGLAELYGAVFVGVGP